MKERDPFQHESSGGFDATCIGSPVFKSIICVLLENIESLCARDIDQFSLFYLSEDPWLNQRSASDSDALHCTADLFHSLIVIKGQNIAISEYGYRLCCQSALLYVLPIGQFCVSLFTGSTVNLEESPNINKSWKKTIFWSFRKKIMYNISDVFFKASNNFF